MPKPGLLASGHRARVLEQLATENAVAVIPSAPLRRFSNDVDYMPYRPDSDFFFLTEFPEPDAVCVLAPGNDAGAFALFVHPRNPEIEVWTGKILGVEGACNEFGADVAFPLGELGDHLPDFLGNTKKVYYPLGRYPEFDTRFLKAMDAVRAQGRLGITAPESIADLASLTHELRLRKTEGELDRLREAVRISRDAHKAAMRISAPGVMEYELEAIVNYTFRRNGAAGPGYGTIVAGGANACTLHYVTNDEPVEDGDLILIDAGAEWHGYTADVTRTWPASGAFTPDQAAVYDIVLAANQAAIEAVAPGVSFDDVHAAALKVLVEGLVELQVLEGPAEDRIEDESYRPYFMHRTSHWLGMDVHDVGGYRKDGEVRLLEPGMVLTIEPGLYFGPTAGGPERFGGIGIRIEDDVVVTSDGHEVLTADIPKARDEICALVGTDA